MFALMVVGALPRMGKTFFLRLLILAAALDPTVELHLYDLKGGPDFRPLEPVAHRFRIGDEPDDLAYLKADIRAIHADMSRRYKTLRNLPRERVPRRQGHPRPRRPPRPRPVAGRCWSSTSASWRSTTTPRWSPWSPTSANAARPPASSSSSPPNASTPSPCRPAISSNAVLRFCLKVAGQVENDMVLGTSMYKAGVRATTFARTDKGVGYLAGEGDDPTIVRTAYLDAPDADTIAARARAARLAAGLLTGDAAGIDPDPDTSTDSILDHLATVWPPTEEKVWWDDLAERLAATYPGLYGTWTGEQVTAAVKPHGLKSVQVKRTVDGLTKNRRGLARTALAAALNDRPDRTDDARPTWPVYTPPARRRHHARIHPLPQRLTRATSSGPATGPTTSPTRAVAR